MQIANIILLRTILRDHGVVEDLDLNHMFYQIMQ